jgi:putative NADH-flavin reductase
LILMLNYEWVMNMKDDLKRLFRGLAMLIVMLAPFFAPVSAEADGLKLIVYGATGRVGSRVVAEALNRGYRVTAVSRDPDRVTAQHQNLIVIKGNVLDPESVATLVDGQDVVVVSVRGSLDNSKDPAKTVHRVAVEVVVGVLRDLGETAPRLIFVGGAGSLEVEPGKLYADSIPWLMRMTMPRSLRQEIDGHVLTLDYLRGVDDVRWTYLSPAKKFGPGERTGKYRIGGDQMLKDDKGRSKISMEDFSVALIDEIENPQFIGKRFSVAY